MTAGEPFPHIGAIERVPLREVWRHEALDFTTWLEHNTDELSKTLGLTIANVEREPAAGSFNVDLVGEDGLGNAVFIENQLGRSASPAHRLAALEGAYLQRRLRDLGARHDWCHGSPPSDTYIVAHGGRDSAAARSSKGPYTGTPRWGRSTGGPAARRCPPDGASERRGWLPRCARAGERRACRSLPPRPSASGPRGGRRAAAPAAR
jgi:hypothetical protein